MKCILLNTFLSVVNGDDDNNHHHRPNYHMKGGGEEGKIVLIHVQVHKPSVVFLDIS